MLNLVFCTPDIMAAQRCAPTYGLSRNLTQWGEMSLTIQMRKCFDFLKIGM